MNAPPFPSCACCRLATDPDAPFQLQCQSWELLEWLRDPEAATRLAAWLGEDALQEGRRVRYAEQLAAEAAVEARCREAFKAVAHFESTHSLDFQVGSNLERGPIRGEKAGLHWWQGCAHLSTPASAPGRPGWLLLSACAALGHSAQLQRGHLGAAALCVRGSLDGPAATEAPLPSCTASAPPHLHPSLHH